MTVFADLIFRKTVQTPLSVTMPAACRQRQGRKSQSAVTADVLAALPLAFVAPGADFILRRGLATGPLRPGLGDQHINVVFAANARRSYDGVLPRVMMISSPASTFTKSLGGRAFASATLTAMMVPCSLSLSLSSRQGASLSNVLH